MTSTPSLFVSGYTEEGYGAGPGIARFGLLPDGTVGECLAQAQGVTNPSFLATGLDGGNEVLLAVEELNNGAVVALDPQTLQVVGRASSGGADTCHIVAHDGVAWTANYSSGTAAVVPLSSLLGGTAPDVPELLSHPGSGPVVERQGESHAHQITTTHWGTVLVSDLGADRVDEYSAISHERLTSAELPPGTGPRHVALKGDFLLVAGELDGYLHVLERAELAEPDGGHFWRWLLKVALAESAEILAAAAEFYPSHIELSADGSKLYAAVRGPDAIVVMDVSRLSSQSGSSGSGGDASANAPRFLHQVPSAGKWPRHFAVTMNKLYVANQQSNQLAVFDVDDQGLPSAEPVQLVEFGSPACILPSR